MKQLFSVFIAVIVLFDVFGAGIGRAPDGRIQVENLKLSLQVILADGTSVEQHQPGVLTFPGEAAEKTEQGLRRYGKFKLTDTAVFDLTETVKRISDCESSFRYVLSTRGESPTRLFSLALRIPSGRLPAASASVERSQPAFFGQAQGDPCQRNPVSVAA